MENPLFSTPVVRHQKGSLSPWFMYYFPEISFAGMWEKMVLFLRHASQASSFNLKICILPLPFSPLFGAEREGPYFTKALKS